MQHNAARLEVLSSLRSFTAERDRDALMTALLKTLIETLPIAQASFSPGDDAGSTAQALRRPGAAGGGPVLSIALDESYGSAGTLRLEALRGAAIERAIVDAMLGIHRNFTAVIDDARRDTLTGLLNRKTFEQSIQDVLVQARAAIGDAPPGLERRQPEPPDASHWLAVLDIDHFKRVNDTFGHLYGDEVLILVARLMARTFRKTDRTYRFGGEEFAVLLSPTSPENARMVLERFRAAVEQYAFPQVGRVTISIGFVAIASQDIPASVIGAADLALYAAKDGGRNRVVAHADLAQAAAAAQESSVDLF